jgi:hypothetical protein
MKQYKAQYKLHENTVQTTQKHSTNNTKHSKNNTEHIKYKYTYYQNIHTSQNQLKRPQYKMHTKWNSHNTIKYPHPNVQYIALLSPNLIP